MLHVLKEKYIFKQFADLQYTSVCQKLSFSVLILLNVLK
jgi:hypothetical protein